MVRRNTATRRHTLNFKCEAVPLMHTRLAAVVTRQRTGRQRKAGRISRCSSTSLRGASSAGAPIPDWISHSRCDPSSTRCACGNPARA